MELVKGRYLGKAHRSMADHIAVSLPPSIEIKNSPLSGRGLYARSEFPRGSKLLNAHPLAHVVKNSLKAEICHNCLKKLKELLRCGRCKFVYYCSKSCQKGDWGLHKGECRGLEKMPPGSVPTDTMRLVLRLLTITTVSPTAKQELDCLISNEDKMSKEVKMEMGLQVMGVVSLLGNTQQDKSEISSILGRVMSNAFNIMDSNHDECFGVGLYNGMSFLNHSCDPNCVVVFNSSCLFLRSIKPIHPGDELMIAYCEVLNLRKRRHDHLKKVYCFECDCSRCSTEESENSPLHVMYASKSQDISVEKRMKVMEEGFSLLDNDLKELEKKNDWSGFVEKCDSAIEECKKVVHPMNVVLTRLREQLMRGQLELKQWEEALDTGLLLLQPYKSCVSPYNPISVVHLIKLAKLRRLLDSTLHLQEATSLLTEALHRIPITFGSDSSLMSEALHMLRDTQGELKCRTNES